MHEKQLAGAKAALDRAIPLMKSQASLWLLRSQVHEQLGDFGAAARDLRTSLKLAPQQPDAAKLQTHLAELEAE